MIIACPKCHFSREVPDNSVPASARMATCPKCKYKFNFRDTEPSNELQAEVAPPPVPEGRPSRPQTPRSEASRPPVAEAQDSQTSVDRFQEHDGQAQSHQEPADAPDESEVPPKEGEDIWSRLDALRPSEKPPVPPWKNRQQASPQGGGRPAPTSEVPWEKLEEYGFFRGLLLTLKAVLLSPARFFASMPITGGLGRPFGYFLIVSLFGELCSTIWTPLVRNMILTSEIYRQHPEAFDPLFQPLAPSSMALGIVAAAVQMVVVFFLSVVVQHVLLRLFRADDAGFEGTFRTACYAASPAVLLLIPYAGWLLAPLLHSLLLLVGFKHVHRTSYGRVVLAMLLPYAIMIAMAFTLYGLMRGPA